MAETAGRTSERTTQDGLAGSSRLGVYLRRLREGYGYTLRKVEERAEALGEAIDNSQLSRFEKGKAVPSFDKLRALARIFNVSVQNFSDVLDLEAFERFKPSGTDFDSLLAEGRALYTKGEHGRAFVTFERALEVSERDGDAERIVEVRRHMAMALRKLGKLSMTEHELREILKVHEKISRRARMRSLLQLGYVYRECGDLYLASVLVRECLDLALEDADLEMQASVHNSLGNILHDQGDLERGLVHYRRALDILEAAGGNAERRLLVKLNIGGCLASLHQFHEGATILRETFQAAQDAGYRRTSALALTRLAEAFLQRGDHEKATRMLLDSDSIASRADEAYHDILFLNAFRRWEMAREESNGTREKIAFGRLRHLRSLIERRFPEVDVFDRYVESTRRRHVHAS